jgi:hypothetical protein
MLKLKVSEFYSLVSFFLMLHNGHMYEMFGDCGLRTCLPLQKLMRGRMLQVTTNPPNILYMMLQAVFYHFNLIGISKFTTGCPL